MFRPCFFLIPAFVLWASSLRRNPFIGITNRIKANFLTTENSRRNTHQGHKEITLHCPLPSCSLCCLFSLCSLWFRKYMRRVRVFNHREQPKKYTPRTQRNNTSLRTHFVLSVLPFLSVFFVVKKSIVRAVEQGSIDTKLLPCNLPMEFIQDGLQVVISGEVKSTPQSGFGPCCTENFVITKITR